MRNLKSTGWFIIGLLLLSACSLQRADTSAPPPTDVPAEPTEVEAMSVFGPGTFTFAFPEGWDVAGPDIVSDESGNTYESYSLGENPIASGGPGMSHVVIASAGEWTPEELVLMQCSTCPDNGFEQVTVGGKPGVRTQIGGGGVPMMITWTYVENNGKLIGFAIHDPQTLEPLEQVINSIIFQ